MTDPLSSLNARDAEIARVVAGDNALAALERAIAAVRGVSVETARSDLAAKGHRLAASETLTSTQEIAA